MKRQGVQFESCVAIKFTTRIHDNTSKEHFVVYFIAKKTSIENLFMLNLYSSCDVGL